MSHSVIPLVLICNLVALLVMSSRSYAAIVEHSFHVQNLTVQRLCESRVITAVNGSLPGPTINVREGDTLVVHVFNKSPYNLTIHWHGVFQLFTGWADGPEFVTQCAIQPGNNYTYRFNVSGQEGTLWWHSHVQWLRATVYGALVIRPRAGNSYPFPKPHREYPIILGEWWNANVIDVENEALATGAAPKISDAYTINGQPGDLYTCSSNKTHRITVQKGKTYMLRIINAALNNQLFFKIANHTMTVVAVDAAYTVPYVTDVVVVGPGQTTDVLLFANQPAKTYYMAAHPYVSAAIEFVETATTGILVYEKHDTSPPIMPDLPAFTDTPTAHKFFTNLTGLANGPHWVPVPLNVDEHMFVTINLGLIPCEANRTCDGPLNQRFAASMNNESFVLPSTSRSTMLQGFFNNNISGIYTTDFPDKPPLEFDYTNPINSFNQSIIFTSASTKVKKLKFNSTVEIVLQNTAIIGVENHPIHIHGFNFYVLAQGFGNYKDTVEGRKMFNLVNPQIRNTVSVPVGGWSVVRFTANNPGVWLMHCHLDVHLPWGLSMAFEVENGPTPSTSLPPPPLDIPHC